MTENAGGTGTQGPRIEAQDLEAALAVRRELGPDYEPALVESFVEKLEAALEERVDARVQAIRAGNHVAGRRNGNQLALGIVSVCAGIPITAIAGGIGDVSGMVVAWAGIAAVNLAHALQGRRRA